MDVAAAISEYGFPIVATVGLLYMIHFIWNFITNNIKAKLAEANVTLIALIAGFFIFLTIKYILESVIGQVNGIHGIVQALDNRVKTMNHDIVRLDATMCSVLGIRPDLNRIARADGKEDARRD